MVVPTEHLKPRSGRRQPPGRLSLDPVLQLQRRTPTSTTGGRHVRGWWRAIRRHQVRTENRKTLVIFDEIHHGGDAKTWGEAIREAFDDATRPRAHGYAVPKRRQPHPVRRLRTRSGRVEALAGRSRLRLLRCPCRQRGAPVVFLAYSGEGAAGATARAKNMRRAWEPQCRADGLRLKTALNPAGEWMPAVIAAADKRLQQSVGHVPDAGGMIIASDQTAARAYAKLLTTITGEAPTVVLSDDRFLGPDQPILRGHQSLAGGGAYGVRGCRRAPPTVGVYATSASTPLFFAQAIGRFVRSRRPGGRPASSAIGAEPPAVGQRTRGATQPRPRQAASRTLGDEWDDDLVEDANKTRTSRAIWTTATRCWARMPNWTR